MNRTPLLFSPPCWCPGAYPGILKSQKWKMNTKLLEIDFSWPFFWLLEVTFPRGGFRTFSVKTPSKMKKFFSEGSFDPQTLAPTEYAPVGFPFKLLPPLVYVLLLMLSSSCCSLILLLCPLCCCPSRCSPPHDNFPLMLYWLPHAYLQSTYKFHLQSPPFYRCNISLHNNQQPT